MTQMDPPEPEYEPSERIQEAMARVLWLGATACDMETRADRHTVRSVWPMSGEHSIRTVDQQYFATAVTAEEAAEAFAWMVEEQVASGEIVISHDWGMIVTYRLNDMDMRRIAAAKKRGRPTNTPVILGVSKIADSAGPACLRCGAEPVAADAEPGGSDARCKGAKAR